MQKRIAFFDFDGTITTKDTLLELIRFNFGSFRLALGFLLNSPWILAWKMGLISNQSAKERILRHFFGGTSMQRFDQICGSFAAGRLPSLIRSKAMHEIEKLQQAGAEVFVVSASPANWIQPWTDDIEVRLIATRLETRNGRITGRISEKNCYGHEKPRRIRAEVDLSGYDEIIAYGDTEADRPMMALATISFFKPFR
jgi:phosphatidylglycerophosphatase C